MIKKPSIKALSTSKLADFVYWALIAITAANYSFITFTFSGDQILNGLLKPLAYLRFPLAIVGYFWLVFIHRHANGLGKLTAPIIALMLAVLIAVLPSPDFQEAVQYGFWFVFQVLFLIKYVNYLVDQVGYEGAKVKLMLPIFVMGLYFLLLTAARIPEYNIGRPFPAYFTTRVQVSMIAPLFLGGLACCIRFLPKSQMVKFAVYGLALFCIIVIAVSGKRASILSVLLITFSYFLISMKASGRAFALLIIPIAIAVIYSTGLKDTAIEASEYTIGRVEKGLDSDTATSINARYHIWGLIGELTSEYPLGAGLNVGRQLIGGGLHNTYFGYLLEVGWLGFILLMGILFWSMTAGFFTKEVNKKEILFYILLPCALYSLTEYNTAPGQPLFIPFWAGMAYCLAPKARSKHYARQSKFLKHH